MLQIGHIMCPFRLQKSLETSYKQWLKQFYDFGSLKDSPREWKEVARDLTQGFLREFGFELNLQQFWYCVIIFNLLRMV